jgi:hypothetical protein
MHSSNGLFELELLVHGRPVQEYLHESNVFAEGRKGSEFTLNVRNNSDRRVVAVLSVDGLSVMTGKPATHTDSGYILRSRDTVAIPGWRLNNAQVAHFFFGALPEAYASQMGTPQNIGVIAAAFYYEKLHRPSYLDDLDFNSLRGYPGAIRGGHTFGGGERTLGIGGEKNVSSRGIGAGFGRQTEHNVTSVQFDREEVVAAQLVLRYDEAEGLKARGIQLTSAHRTSDRVIDANPFPGDEPGCKPPSGWRG